MTNKVIPLTTPDELKTSKRMSKLAESFPCLRDAHGVNPFDAKALDRWATDPTSHGQRITAQFILWVWDRSTDWECGRFDLAEALQVWLPEHHRAFLNWTSDPWWP
jgi:hypothetical protein